MSSQVFEWMDNGDNGDNGRDNGDADERRGLFAQVSGGVDNGDNGDNGKNRPTYMHAHPHTRTPEPLPSVSLLSALSPLSKGGLTCENRYNGGLDSPLSPPLSTVVALNPGGGPL